jgi:hypothetical protein
MWTPLFLSHLARANAEIRQFSTAWTNIHEAMTAVETTKENWYEAEINRVAGEIALLSPEPDATKAEAYLERALAVAREQQAKSWELRAAMSMARLLCAQGRQDEARDLLAPVYGWFTEGFDTLDLKQAKAMNCTPDNEFQNGLLGPLSPQLRPPRPRSAMTASRRFETSLKRLKCADSVEKLGFSSRSQLSRPCSRYEKFLLGTRPTTAVATQRSS